MAPPDDPEQPCGNKLAMTKVKQTTLGSIKKVPWYYPKEPMKTGTEIYQNPNGLTFSAEPTITTSEQLTQTPTSRSALIIDNLLMVSKSKEYFDSKTHKSETVTSFAEANKSPHSADYLNDPAYLKRMRGDNEAPRAPLVDIDILKDPSNLDRVLTYGHDLHYRMIAHQEDKATGFNGLAYYNIESHSVIIVFPGVDFGKGGDWDSLHGTLNGKTNPQTKYVDAFMQHVVQETEKTILQNGGIVEHSVITSHSLGASSAISATAWLMQHPKEAEKLGKEPPKTVSIEGWQESKVGPEIAKQYHVNEAQLKDRIHSVRDYPGTFINVENNTPYGAHVTAIMPPELDVSYGAFAKRNMAHMVVGAAERLIDNKVGIIDNFPGAFKATELMEKTYLPTLKRALNLKPDSKKELDNIKKNMENSFSQDMPYLFLPPVPGKKGPLLH